MGKDNFHSKKHKMKYVAAYCLMALAGKTSVSAADLKKFMTSAGMSDLNDDNLNACCDALKGKELHEVINAGFGKISSLSLGGGGSSSGNAGPAENKAAAVEEKEEVVEEEEEDMDLGDLFGYVESYPKLVE